MYDFVARDIILNVVVLRILSFDCGLDGVYGYGSLLPLLRYDPLGGGYLISIQPLHVGFGCAMWPCVCDGGVVQVVYRK